MLIDRDVRFCLLSTMQVLQFSNDWMSVKDVIDCLEMRMMRRYDRRSIYANFNTLEDFGYIESKHSKHNIKFVRWIHGATKGQHATIIADVRDQREALQFEHVSK